MRWSEDYIRLVVTVKSEPSFEVSMSKSATRPFSSSDLLSAHGCVASSNFFGSSFGSMTESYKLSGRELLSEVYSVPN